jgi:(E)-4-hydroxy-3-methylbut-2-enyl-diphosphate synthase
LDKWNISDRAADFIYIGDKPIQFEVPGTLRLIRSDDRWEEQEDKTKSFPLYNKYDYADKECEKSKIMNFIMVHPNDLVQKFLNKIKKDPTVVLILDTSNLHGMAEQRSMFLKLNELDIHCPVIIHRTYENIDAEHFQLNASTDAGALLLDGFGDGIMFTVVPEGMVPDSLINNTAFGILQATRNRISKTEYISCPSCGRTLFDLQETTEKIRRRTDHLKGLKIGIMGCIVNGPGEMADADYGYVGVGKGKVTLYKGKEVVRRSIDSELAVDALIDLIKENGDWIEKEIIQV